MIGYGRIGVLHAHDVLGTRGDSRIRGDSRTRGGNHTQGGNHTRGGDGTRAVELSLAVRFPVVHHVVVICVAVWFMRKENS